MARGQLLTWLDDVVGRGFAWCRRRPLAMAGSFAYAVVVSLWLATQGFPMETRSIAELTVLGLLCASLDDLKRFARGIIADWMPFFFILFGYDLLRGRADDFSSHVHMAPQWNLDKWLGDGTTITSRLQHALWSGSPRWWDYFALVVYLSHFVMMLLVAAVLWLRDHEVFRRFRTAVVIMFGLALATYASYPAAPPWWVGAKTGSPVHRIVVETIDALAGGQASGAQAPVPAATSHLYNPVAALPSLHAALPMLLLLFFWQSHRRLRPVLAMYVLAMAFTLVYTGEHFVFDILLGWAFAAASVVIGGRVSSAVRRRMLGASSTTTTVQTPIGALAIPIAAAVADH